MARVVVILDLPIATSDDLSTTELALILQSVTAAQIEDYVDEIDVIITPSPQDKATNDIQQYNRNILEDPAPGQYPDDYWGRT